MTVGNDTVQHDLVQIRCLKLQHLVDTGPADLIRHDLDTLLITIHHPLDIHSAKRRADEHLAVLVQQAKRLAVGARRDLDELGEAVADLGLRQRA